MVRRKNHKRVAAAKERMAKRHSMTPDPQFRPSTPPRSGTGYRRTLTWESSEVTQHSHKLVVPDESPDKKFVLLVGDSHLRSLADGFVSMPAGELCFGVMSTPGAVAADLRKEFLHADLPRKPDAICVLAPSNDLKHRNISKASREFGKLLGSICSLHDNVVVQDFPPRLEDVELQKHFRQEYHRVAAAMGVKYFSTAERFLPTNLDLWCKDGVHLSDAVGMPILAELLWFASYMVLLPPVTKPVTPPKMYQARFSPKVVVKGEVSKPRPPVNPFEWTRVGRKRMLPEGLQQSCSIPMTRGRFAVLLDEEEEDVPTSPLASPPSSTVGSSHRQKPHVQRRQRRAVSNKKVPQQQVEPGPSGVQVCSRRSPSKTADVLVREEVEAAESLVTTSSKQLPSRTASADVSEEVDAALSTHVSNQILQKPLMGFRPTWRICRSRWRS